MNKRLLLSATFLATALSAATASANSVKITQIPATGTNTHATAQTGLFNRIVGVQEGKRNNITAVQDGALNFSETSRQAGDQNATTTNQKGKYNKSVVHQDGIGNLSNVTQRGNWNSFDGVQKGGNNTSPNDRPNETSWEQKGNENTAKVSVIGNQNLVVGVQGDGRGSSNGSTASVQVHGTKHNVDIEQRGTIHSAKVEIQNSESHIDHVTVDQGGYSNEADVTVIGDESHQTFDQTGVKNDINTSSRGTKNDINALQHGRRNVMIANIDGQRNILSMTQMGDATYENGNKIDAKIQGINNNVAIEQVAVLGGISPYYNVADVDVEGRDHDITVVQRGRNNEALVDVSGFNNALSLSQQHSNALTEGNDADISIAGNNNVLSASQAGRNDLMLNVGANTNANTGNITQAGQLNYAELNIGTIATASKVTFSNQSSITQKGNNNRAAIFENGNTNIGIVEQVGNDNVGKIIHHPSAVGKTTIVSQIGNAVGGPGGITVEKF